MDSQKEKTIVRLMDEFLDAGHIPVKLCLNSFSFPSFWPTSLKEGFFNFFNTAYLLPAPSLFGLREIMG